MISIVIPLFNKVTTISGAIDSVLAQTVTEWELIVVDDGSQDAGPTVVDGYHDTRIRMVTQVNAGVSAARNRGAELAASDVVAFLDADDYWEATHLANLETLMRHFPGLPLYATAYFVVSDDGAARKIRLRSAGTEGVNLLMKDYFAVALDMGHPVHCSAVAIPKVRLLEVGGFPVGISSGEDIITLARLASIGEIGYSNLPTAYYTRPPSGVKNRKKIMRWPQTPDYVGLELKRLEIASRTCQESIKRYRAEWHRIRSMIFLELNERRASLSELKIAIQLGGISLRDIVCCGLLLLPHGVRASVLAKVRDIRWRA